MNFRYYIYFVSVNFDLNYKNYYRMNKIKDISYIPLMWQNLKSIDSLYLFIYEQKTYQNIDVTPLRKYKELDYIKYHYIRINK